MARRLGREARWLGRAQVEGRLYRITHYPGLVAGRGVVVGDLYYFDGPSEPPAWLDVYEGCDGDATAEYRRESWPVTLTGGRCIAAWCYLYQRPTQGRARIRSGDFCAQIKNSES